MKNFTVTTGSFTEAGNFSARTSMDERIHVFARQMESLGYKKGDTIAFPFYVIGDVKQIGQLDANREPVLDLNGNPVTKDRLTALSVFKTREGIEQAHIDNSLLDIQIAAAIRAEATKAGLSESAFKQLETIF